MRMHIRKLAVAAALLIGGAAYGASRPTFYVVSHSGPGDPFWAVMHKGVMEAGEKLGARVIFTAPDQPGNVAKQVSLLQAAIAARPDGIALTVPDRKVMARPLQDARKRGIPVVAFDTREDPRDMKELPYQAYIGADEYRSGRKVAEQALLSLAPGSKVVITTPQPGHMGFELRIKGIKDVLSAKKFKIDVLDLTASTSKGIAVLSSYFKRNTGVKAIFSLAPLTLTAIGKYLSENKPAAPYFISSFDLDAVTIRYIKDGLLNFTLDQMPYMQAFMLITQLNLAHKFALTPVDIDTGGGFVNKDNVAMVEDLVKKGYR